MSFFGSQGQSAQPDPQRIEMALAELEILTDALNRMMDSCHNKCINPSYKEADLNKGESVCVDRCVAKFFEVNKKVGEKMQSMNNGGGAGGGAPRSF